MKIVLAVNHFAPQIGGCEIVTKRIADYLHERGHEMFVITRRLKGRDSRDFPYQVIEYMPQDFRGFEKKVDSIKPDLLMVYSDVFDFFRFILSSSKPYRLFLCLCGANWLHANRNFARILYRNAGKILALVCHSEHDRDYRLCSAEMLKRKRVVIPNGIDLKEFDSNTLRREDLLPDHVQKRWILNVSNFFPGKGQNYIIDILNQLPDNEKYVYVQVSSTIGFSIGEKLENEWKKITKLKLNKNIKTVFKKDVSRDQVVGFFKQSNVFAFTTEKEVAPLVLLEAMSSELPWVSADVGNTRGLKGGKVIGAIKNSKYHSVFDDRVKRLFAQGIQEVWNSPGIGKEGRTQVENEMTWDKVLPQYASLIEK